MEKKTVFSKFSNDIYPISVFVGVTNDFEVINEHFTDVLGNDIEPQNYWNAFVQPAVHKESNERCVMIVFFNKRRTTSSIIAHEALHAADVMGNWLGLDWLNNGCNEAYAYLTGWVVRCCNKCIKGRED